MPPATVVVRCRVTVAPRCESSHRDRRDVVIADRLLTIVIGRITAPGGLGDVTPSPLFTELTTLFRAQPAATARLLAQHVDDGTGHCRVCTAGGQTGHYTSPCVIQLAAEEAHASRQSDEAVQR
jgi:hypothetical protein